jgi:tRNA uridine 5-carboxymethylaminomethyl modification enzyme
MTLRGVDGQQFTPLAALEDAAKEQIEIQLKYAGYIDRQAKEVERHEHYENLKLPAEIDYMEVKALSIEVRQKLNKHRPETLGQASRIAGVTPAAISLLLVHLKKGGFKEFAAIPASSTQAAA